MPEVLSEVKVPGKTQTADDINDLFKSIDGEENSEKDESSKKIKSDKEDELELKEDKKDSEDELEFKVDEEEKEEKIDLKEDFEIDAPPRKKEILAKYPDLFKTFPFLEKVLYRDKQYTELFGSFDDAKEIAERSESFNEFETQLLSGNTEEILRELKNSDPQAFNKIADNYLLTLHKVDKEAYFHVTGNLNRRLIQEMVEEGNQTGNDDLKQAALLVNQFVFGTSKFTTPNKLVNETEESGKSEIEKERLDYLKERFETSRDELQTRVDNTLRATIDSYIDPRNQMTPFAKKHAVSEAMKYISETLVEDSAIVKHLDKLWRAAFDSKFSKESLSRIQHTYLGKAKSLLKDAIMKARAEALKDVKTQAKPEKEEVEENSTEDSPKKRITPGRTSEPKGKNQMKKGESVSEFFARD